MPLLMVAGLVPVALATAATPPYPRSRASRARYCLRCLSHMPAAVARMAAALSSGMAIARKAPPARQSAPRARGARPASADGLTCDKPRPLDSLGDAPRGLDERADGGEQRSDLRLELRDAPLELGDAGARLRELQARVAGRGRNVTKFSKCNV